LIAIGFLAFQRFSNIAYMTSDYAAISGWAALLAGWPVYSFIIALATFIGLLLGGWIGQNSRERDAAERLATQQAELEGQQLQAQKAEQEARVKAAEATQAKRDAEALIGPSQERINSLSEENALLKHRLAGSVEALERKKRQLREIKKNDGDVLLAEIERLRGMIREDRQQIQRLEERLRTAKSAVS
jgi:chromosome segregation ATPase